MIPHAVREKKSPFAFHSFSHRRKVFVKRLKSFSEDISERRKLQICKRDVKLGKNVYHRSVPPFIYIVPNEIMAQHHKAGHEK